MNEFNGRRQFSRYLAGHPNELIMTTPVSQQVYDALTHVGPLVGDDAQVGDGVGGQLARGSGAKNRER